MYLLRKASVGWDKRSAVPPITTNALWAPRSACPTLRPDAETIFVPFLRAEGYHSRPKTLQLSAGAISCQRPRDRLPHIAPGAARRRRVRSGPDTFNGWCLQCSDWPWPPCWGGCSGGGFSFPPSISPACRSSITTRSTCPRRGSWRKTWRRFHACRGTIRPPSSAICKPREGIATLANRLRGFAAKPRDTLILYLKVYGVSDDGKAWVLCSDYLRSRQGGRCSLADVLDQIGQSPAGKKLVILDFGDLDCDPRLGLFVNEFADLARGGSPPREGSRPVGAGLSPAAGRRLHLAERPALGLRSLRHRGPRRRRRPRRRRHGRTGRIARFRPRRRIRLGEPAERRGRDANPLAAARRRRGRGSAAGLALVPISEQASDSESDNKKPPPSAATAEPDHKAAATRQSRRADPVRRFWKQAWQLRDGIEHPFTAAPITPIDYAPHLWRAYNELLLGYELRYRGGSEYDPKILADDLRTNILTADILSTGQPLPAAAGRASLVSRLADAQQLYLAESEDWSDPLANDPQATPLSGIGCGERTQLVFRAFDYVRWHAAAERYSPRQAAAISADRRLSRPTADLRRPVRLVRVAGRRSVVRRPRGRRPGRPRPAGRDPRRLRKTIEDEGLYKDAADLIEAATKNPAKTGLAGPMDALLSTSLLRAPLRMKLLHARMGLQQPIDVTVQTGNAPQPPSPASWSSRLSDQALLEQRLVGIGRSVRDVSTAAARRCHKPPHAVGRLSAVQHRPGRLLSPLARGNQSRFTIPRPGGRSPLWAIAQGGRWPRRRTDSRRRDGDGLAPAVGSPGGRKTTGTPGTVGAGDVGGRGHVPLRWRLPCKPAPTRRTPRSGCWTSTPTNWPSGFRTPPFRRKSGRIFRSTATWD